MFDRYNVHIDPFPVAVDGIGIRILGIRRQEVHLIAFDERGLWKSEPIDPYTNDTKWSLWLPAGSKEAMTLALMPEMPPDVFLQKSLDKERERVDKFINYMIG